MISLKMDLLCHSTPLSETLTYHGPIVFRFLQVRSFARKHFSTYPEDCLRHSPVAKGQIYHLYNFLLGAKSPSLLKLKKAWEDDLGINITDEIWDHCINHIHSSSICI